MARVLRPRSANTSRLHEVGTAIGLVVLSVVYLAGVMCGAWAANRNHERHRPVVTINFCVDESISRIAETAKAMRALGREMRNQ